MALLATTAATAAGAPPTPGAVHGTPQPAGRPASTASPSGSARNITFDSLGQATQTLGGYDPGIDLYIPVPGQGNIGPDSQLQVRYSQSPLLDPHTSSISIYVNNAFLAGRLLSGAPGAQQVLTVNVPANTLNTTVLNHIQVTFSLKSVGSNVACGSASPDLNVTVFGSSWFRYDLRQTFNRFQPALGELPSPFTSPSSPIVAPVLVGLPDVPSATELTAAARILARMGEDYPSSPPHVLSASGPTIQTRGRHANLLLVGTPRDNPHIPSPASPVPFHLRAGRWADASGHPLPASEGVIYETPSPYDARYASLVVTGNGQEGIRRAGVILSSATLRRLLHGPFALVPTAPQLPTELQTRGRVIPLSALGYDNINVEGFGEHDSRITFDMSQRTNEPGSLNLIFSHAGVSPSDTSSLRVDLNGQPIGSRVFRADDPSRISWTVSLPPEQLLAGSNVLTLRFFFTLPPSCTVPPSASSYGTVDASSTLFLPTSGVGGNPDLSLLPFPLVKDGSPDDLLLVIANRVSDQHDALEVAPLVGVRCHVDAPLLEASGVGSTSMRLLRKKTVLLDGLPSTNALIAEMDRQLPLHVSHGLRVSADTPGLRTTVRESGALGVIEEIPSPWGPTRTSVVVTASQAGLLPAARQALFQGLTGNVATVTAQGTIQTFDTRGAQQLGLETSQSRPVDLLAATGVVFVFLVVAAALLQRRRLGSSQ